MNNIVLYCKSFVNDVDRLHLLIESIKKHNIDNIPTYVSVPSSDINIFKNKIDTSYVNLIEDESIYQSILPGYLSQQVIKSNFWRLNECKNYLCLDSDSLFIKDFKESDFIFTNDIPYTVCHQQKSLFEWSINNLNFNPKDGFIKDRQTVMDIFNRKGVHYDFGPSPVIWSKKVWKNLDTTYIEPNNITFDDLIKYCASEFCWYGESLLSMNFPIYPLEPLFKVYHYEGQYIQDKQQNITVNQLKENYFGIILQSNWNAPKKY